jgi:hypothetical protein
MNKKGQIKYILLFIPRVVFMVIVFVTVGMLIGKFINSGLESETLEEKTALYRLLYSSDAMSYVDETGRSYPFIIDRDKFTTENLEDSLSYSYEKYISMQFTLEGEDFSQRAYVNELWFERLFPLADANIIGLGGASMVEEEYPVLYYDENNNLKSATLKAVVVRAHS